jgi:hypothetical protein
MDELRGKSDRTRSAVSSLLLAVVSIGCMTEPPVHSALPGSFYLTSDPPLAPNRLTIREDDIGGPSRRTAQFDEGDTIVVKWSTLPLPPEKWIEVNGEDCEGTFGIQARIETDLLLILTDDACRVELLGSHPEGGPHHSPGE